MKRYLFIILFAFCNCLSSVAQNDSDELHQAFLSKEWIPFLVGTDTAYVNTRKIFKYTNSINETIIKAWIKSIHMNLVVNNEMVITEVEFNCNEGQMKIDAMHFYYGDGTPISGNVNSSPDTEWTDIVPGSKVEYWQGFACSLVPYL